MLRRFNLLNIIGDLINPATHDAQIDGSQIVQSIGWEHQRIHEGNHYQVAGYELGLGDNDTVAIALTSPADREVHLNESFFAVNGGTLEIYEGASVTGGTVLNIPNNNRNSLNTSGVIARLNPTVTTNGSLLWRWLMGGDRESGDAVRNHEQDLAKSTTYLLLATCTAALNGISWDLNFYEEFD